MRHLLIPALAFVARQARENVRSEFLRCLTSLPVSPC